MIILYFIISFVLHLRFMLAVRPQQFELPRDEISMDSAPTFDLR